MKNQQVNGNQNTAIPPAETKPARMLEVGTIAPVGIDNLLAQMVANGDIAIELVDLPITFSNYRVQYIAPTKPEHSFEPRCHILADDAEFGGATVRVFDVPDPDESQRAVAQLACDALNSLKPMAAALGYVREQIDLDLPRFKDADDSDTVAIEITVGWLREVRDALALVEIPAT